MAWFAVIHRRPWPLYDCWRYALEKGPGGFPETNPFIYLRISKEMSGLPVDIFVQDGDAYLDTDSPLLVLVHNGYGPFRFSDLLPVSVSVLPRVLLRCYEKNLTEKDLATLKSFIRKHRRTLRHLADGPSSTVRTSRLIKQLMGG